MKEIARKKKMESIKRNLGAPGIDFKPIGFDVDGRLMLLVCYVTKHVQETMFEFRPRDSQHGNLAPTRGGIYESVILLVAQFFTVFFSVYDTLLISPHFCRQ